MSDFDVVIFDCDGVLIDSEVISAKMLIEELLNYGVSITMDYVVSNFLGRSYAVVLSQIRTEFGVQLSDGFEQDYRHRLMEAFRSDLKIIPHVKQVIEQLNVPYHLATSSSPARLDVSLGIVGLRDLFDGCASTSSEVSNGKPAPDLFLYVAEKMGVSPDRCLVIEDSNAGVQAALAAGMTVWRFVGGTHLKNVDIEPQDTATPHLTFASFDKFFHFAPQLIRGN